ncbi:hypothetical protein ScPMuIL_015948 [Solemya velum]
MLRTPAGNLLCRSIKEKASGGRPSSWRGRSVGSPRGGGGDPVSSREENVVTDSPRGEDETPAPPPGGESEINPSEADIVTTDPLPQEEKQMADNRISTQLISDVHEGTGDVIGDSVVLSDDSMAVDIIEDIHKVEDTLEGIHDQSLERIGSTESINLPDSFSGAQPVYEPTVNTRASKKAQRGKRKGNNQPSAIPRKSKSTQKEPPNRSAFISKLDRHLCSPNIILGGDFNCIIDTALDKVGGNPQSGTAGSTQIKDLCRDMYLKDAYRTFFSFPVKRPVTGHALFDPYPPCVPQMCEAHCCSTPREDEPIWINVWAGYRGGPEYTNQISTGENPAAGDTSEVNNNIPDKDQQTQPGLNHVIIDGGSEPSVYSDSDDQNLYTEYRTKRDGNTHIQIPITVQFRVTSPLVVYMCNNLTYYQFLCSDRIAMEGESAGEPKQMATEWRLAVGQHFQSFYKFRLSNMSNEDNQYNEVCSSSRTRKDGLFLEEYNLHFYRICSDFPTQ